MEENKKKPLWIRIVLWALAIVTLLIGAFSFTLFRASCARNDLEDKRLDFSVVDKNGAPVSLSNFQGTPIVVNFWAIWCPPCKQELPDFQDAYDEYKDEVTFLFVNVIRWQGDTVEDVELFMSENGYTFPVYYDTDGNAAETCGVSSIPLTLFIGRDGEVKKTYNAAIPAFLLRNYIEDIL